MADNDEKILPILRLLIIAFFGLLLVVVLQLFLLVTRAHAATAASRVLYTQMTDGAQPWNIAENQTDRQTG